MTKKKAKYDPLVVLRKKKNKKNKICKFQVEEVF